MRIVKRELFTQEEDEVGFNLINSLLNSIKLAFILINFKSFSVIKVSNTTFNTTISNLTSFGRHIVSVSISKYFNFKFYSNLIWLILKFKDYCVPKCYPSFD
jgi:hypothetical protein